MKWTLIHTRNKIGQNIQKTRKEVKMDDTKIKKQEANNTFNDRLNHSPDITFSFFENWVSIYTSYFITLKYCHKRKVWYFENVLLAAIKKFYSTNSVHVPLTTGFFTLVFQRGFRKTLVLFVHLASNTFSKKRHQTHSALLIQH